MVSLRNLLSFCCVSEGLSDTAKGSERARSGRESFFGHNGSPGRSVYGDDFMSSISRLLATSAAVLVFTVLFLPAAEANIRLSQRACQTYASWSGNLVWARDIGADKEKARSELVGLDQKTPLTIYALMLRNLETLWTTTADWESVTLVILQDCINRRGMYEAAT